MVEELSIETPTHGRVLIDRPAERATAIVLAFHGYAQNAEAMLTELRAIPGSEAWALVSVQALHRFYSKGERDVVSSWMTRQNRDEAIADNVAYVDRVVKDIGNQFDELIPDIFCLGFSQGAAMAYRAGLRGARRATGIIAVGGDVPPDVKDVPAARWPRVLVAAGDTDYWYTPEKVTADAAFLRTHGVAHEFLHYTGGHVFTERVHQAIADFVRSAR